MEKVGRYLCRLYYTGRLGCSASYGEGSSEYFLARCVEKVLEDSKGHRGRTAEVWRKLMSGDLAGLNHVARSRVMGGRAENRGEMSIDGGSLHELEVFLWDAVGREFARGVRG